MRDASTDYPYDEPDTLNIELPKGRTLNVYRGALTWGVRIRILVPNRKIAKAAVKLTHKQTLELIDFLQLTVDHGDELGDTIREMNA